MNGLLPRRLDHVHAPPINCQGIKTKLVPFIADNIAWTGRGRWIEPFMGSGSVLFNIAPPRVLAGDVNPFLVSFYRGVQAGTITPETVHRHLADEGARLAAEGEDHYYRLRERFNRDGDPLDFLFLNRSCFNGLIRFNARGGFNVPFCRKPLRFAPAYITKIVNQVRWVRSVMWGRDWEFRVVSWDALLAEAGRDDLVYLDPPYVGRHTDYYDRWSDEDAVRLARVAAGLPSGVALSMWLENEFRRNDHLTEHWRGMEARTTEHFYHVGSTESLRHPLVEALAISPGHAVSASGPGVPVRARRSLPPGQRHPVSAPLPGVV